MAKLEPGRHGSRSHHRYDDEYEREDRVGRRTPRGYRDRSHHSREESRERYRGHRSHGEEPRPHSCMEGHVREDEDWDTGQQQHAHDRDTYMELDHRSQQFSSEVPGSDDHRYPSEHRRERTPVAEPPFISPGRASSQGTSRASLSQSGQSSAWDQLLGPAEQEDPLQDPDTEPDVEWSPPRVTSAPSPAFKPSYTRSQLGPECSAKRKLDMGGGDASGLPPTAMEKEKIRSLGNPYATNKVPEAQSETGQDPPLSFLSPEVSAPFFAAAMLDAGIPVHFPPDEGAEAGELGEAEKARVRKPIRPWIPMTQSL